MYKKRIQLRRRIIHLENLLELSSFFEALKATEGGSFTLCVWFRDGSAALKTSSQIIYDANFKYKDVARFHFDYTSRDHRKKISLWLEENTFLAPEFNNFEIISDDEAWLNDIEARFNGVVAGLPKLSLLRTAFTLPWVLGTFLLFAAMGWGFIQLQGFSYGARPMLSDGQPDPAAIFIPLSWVVLVAVIVFTLIAVIVCQLYPEQEFAFGIARHPRRVKLRKVFGWILASVVVPLVLALL